MPLDDPAYRFGFRLAEVARLWRQELDARLRPLGLSQARWTALVHLAAAPGGLTQHELAQRVGIKGSTLVRQLDLLEADGWVERHESPHDRRVRRVVLTERAEPSLQAIAAIAGTLRAELLGEVGEPELATCLGALDRIREKLQAMPRNEVGASSQEPIDA